MLLISLLVVVLICLVSQLLIDGIPYTNDKEERVPRVLLINNTMTATTSHEKQSKHIAELMSNRDTPMNVLKNLSSHHSEIIHESGIGMNSNNLPNKSLASGVSRVDVGINMMRKLYYTRSNNKSTTAQTGNLQNVKVPIQFPTIFNSSVLTESFECIQKRYVHVRPGFFNNRSDHKIVRISKTLQVLRILEFHVDYAEKRVLGAGQRRQMAVS